MEGPSNCEKFFQYFPSVSEYEEFFSTYAANCVFNSFLSHTAIALNIVAIHAIRKTSAISKPLKTLLISLAVSDLGIGLLAHPFYAILLVRFLRQNHLGCFTYKAIVIFNNFISGASFFGVVAISVDRFLAIHLHLRYQELVTCTRTVIVVILVWLLSAVASLLVLWLSSDIHHLTLVSVGVIGLLVTVVVYIRIYFVLRRHRNDIEELNGGGVVTFARLRKSVVGTFYVYVVFLVCYLPCAICLALFVMYGPSIPLKNFFLYAWTLIFLNSSLNPVIYCWKMRHIRCAILRMLRNMWRRKSPQTQK